VPTPICFDIKVPSSGSSSATKARRSNLYFDTIRSHFHHKICVIWSFNNLRHLTHMTKNINRIYTGCFIMFSVITNIYNKKTKGPTLMELFIATGKLKKVLFDY
jgi:hypothetical protein